MRMRRVAPYVFVVLAIAAVALAEQPAGLPVVYRFDEVKSKMMRLPGADPKSEEVKAKAGDAAAAGDTVRTGFWGRAILSVPDRACRFEVFSSTRVRLAGGEPGVILFLESGRLEAFFDKFTGAAEERRVAAPGALLVVRGTRYGVETGAGEQSTLAVFEGTVEVLPKAPGARRLLVGPGEYGVFGPKISPRKGAIAPGADERSWRSRGTAALEGSSGLQQGQGPQTPLGTGSQGRGGPSASRGGH